MFELALVSFAMSVPASEYNETLIKGQSMISAITDAQEVE